MKAIWNGAVLAQTDKTEVVEGNHYFPPNRACIASFSKRAIRTRCVAGRARQATTRSP